MIEWRYQDQLDWRLVLIGLSEDTSGHAEHGFTPLRVASMGLRFRERYGMPFSPDPKPGLSASSRACRAVIVARERWPGSEWQVLRALQLANFNACLLFDDDARMREVLSPVPGVDADEIVALIDDSDIVAAYEEDKALARTAAGSPTELQGGTGNSDGAVRYSAPSLLFEAADGRRLQAGGFQPVEAYDVVLANLDRALERHAPPEDVGSLLEYFAFGLTTQEVAALMAAGNDRPDRLAAEIALVALVDAGRAERLALGDDAVWTGADEHPGEHRLTARALESSA